jgi:hypothetical protein
MIARLTTRPQADEHAPYYSQYIARVPDGADVFDLLRRQPGDLRLLLRGTTEAQSSVRPAPDEWSIKEVVGHISDTERVFAYRALRIARADPTPLPGFDQDLFVRSTDFNRRTLADLLEEFELQRRANVLLFASLTDEEIARVGTASTFNVSVRALVFMAAGHVEHHVYSLKTDYHVES